MCRIGLMAIKFVALAALVESSSLGTAQAQGYGGYSNYAPSQGGWSVQFGGGGGGSGYVSQGYSGYQSVGAGYGGLGYSSGWSSGAGVACQPYYSPAQRQGYREGQYYYETGIAPNRTLSPAEARGFINGERRAASTPWQLDPVRQQGYREGQVYWETGQLPNRPLSPAEAQGFRAGENRAAAGLGYGYANPY